MRQKVAGNSKRLPESLPHAAVRWVAAAAAAASTHGEDQVDGGVMRRRAGGPGRRPGRGLATGPAFREGNLAAACESFSYGEI